MVGRLNDIEMNDNINEIAAVAFKEVLGERSSYVRGLEHSVMLKHLQPCVTNMSSNALLQEMIKISRV